MKTFLTLNFFSPIYVYETILKNNFMDSVHILDGSRIKKNVTISYAKGFQSKRISKKIKFSQGTI